MILPESSLKILGDLKGLLIYYLKNSSSTPTFEKYYPPSEQCQSVKCFTDLATDSSKNYR